MPQAGLKCLSAYVLLPLHTPSIFPSQGLGFQAYATMPRVCTGDFLPGLHCGHGPSFASHVSAFSFPLLVAGTSSSESASAGLLPAWQIILPFVISPTAPVLTLRPDEPIVPPMSSWF